RQPFERRRGLVDRSGHLRNELLLLVPERGERQLVARGEVEVEGALGEPALADQAVQRDAVVSVFGERRRGGPEDPEPRALGALLSGSGRGHRRASVTYRPVGF